MTALGHDTSTAGHGVIFQKINLMIAQVNSGIKTSAHRHFVGHTDAILVERSLK